MKSMKAAFTKVLSGMLNSFKSVFRMGKKEAA